MALLLLAGLAAVGTAAVPDNLVSDVKNDARWLSEYTSRLVGSDEHDQALKALLDQIKAVPGAHVWTQTFPVVAHKNTKSELTVTKGPLAGTYPIYPLWPNGPRLHTTPKEGLHGKPVYIGDAQPVDMPTKSVVASIAVVEASAANNWMNAFNAGAESLILLGSPQTEERDIRDTFTYLPHEFQMYYLPESNLSNPIRKGELEDARIICEATWTQTAATNIIALIMPSDKKTPTPAFTIAVQFDSMSMVPSLAPGADAAVDVAFALNLLRHYASHPPARPVLFVFIDDFTVAQLGMREFLSTLTVTPKDRKDYASEDKDLIEEYEEHEAIASELGSGVKALDEMYRDKFRLLHPYIKDEISREVVAIEKVLGPLRLKTRTAQGQEAEKIRKEIQRLSESRTAYFAVQRELFTKSPTSKNLLPLANTIWDRASTRIERQLREEREYVDRINQKHSLRLEVLKELGLAEQTNPIQFLLGIDLSDAGIDVGPSLECRYLAINELSNSRDMRAWLASIVDDCTSLPAETRSAIKKPLGGLDSIDSHSAGDVTNLTSPAQSFGVPAMSWATLDGRRTRVDTPNDRFEYLDWSRLSPQIVTTYTIIDRLVTQTDFNPTARVLPKWSRVNGSVVDQSAGEPVPRVPMQGFLTTLTPGGTNADYSSVGWMNPCSGMRRSEFRFTGADGRFRFDNMPGSASLAYTRFFLQSYLVDPSGEIHRTINLAQAEGSSRLAVDVAVRRTNTLRALVFDGVPFSVVGFSVFDPRFMLNLPLASVLDAERSGKPRRLNLCRYDGQWTCFLEPGTKWEFLARIGSTSNRIVMLNMADPASNPSMSVKDAIQGFPVDEPPPVNLLLNAARDVFRLDEMRLKDYRAAGITSQLIDNIRIRSKDCLEQADKSVEDDDGGDLFRYTTGALANELRAYHAVLAMANDVVRAAIFLLLALVPFSYALERLLFASAHVYKQIAGIAGIFTFMTGILWSFHPAFKISSQPLMIIMSFGIIFMSLLVMSVVYSKFEGGLEELRSGLSESSGASTSRGGVLYSAIGLGIANMRNRKLRTALTGITVILITFVLLCFTSTSSYVGKKQQNLNVKCPYPGVLIRQPSTRVMPTSTFDYVKNVVDATATVVPRYWWCNVTNPQWVIHVKNAAGGQAISLKAALGLDGDEPKVTGIDRCLPNWERFAKGHGCYVAAEAAKQLGVSPGDSLVVAGEAFELIGVFDAAQIDREIRDMDGQTLMPVNLSAFSGDQAAITTSLDMNMLEVQLASGSPLEVDQELPRLTSASVIILPVRMLLGNVRDCTLRSVAVRADSYEQAERIAEELASRVAFPIYFSGPERVKAYVSTILLPQAPKSLFVPLAIGGLIILNTMLGSIAERKRDIYIYTSMGLAPLHVGFLFLAEAITYGLMGSIFGYVVGQGVATLFTHLGLLQGITLNYSGSYAILTMFLVLVVVVLSSLLPAYLAGRLAVPSTNMTWRVPQPVDDVIRDTLPFTVTEKTANGVAAFLYEYLDAHRDGCIGHFTTDNLRVFSIPANGQDLLGIEGMLWLSPYDLGVRQDFRLTLRATGEEDVCEMDIELRRGSGQVGSWWNLNKVFLADLRKQLLGWRKLKLQRMLHYIVVSRKMLPK